MPIMRHDAERPQTTHLIVDAPVPGHWIQVLATMRTSPFTRLSLDEIRSEAARILIVSPSDEVARTCFAELFDATTTGAESPDATAGAADDFITITTAEAVVAENVPAGTWVFLPHRLDGWTELETTSAKVRAMLVKENAARAKDEKLTLIEYGVNLWLWAEPPYAGGDPVCHAGELISWESAWTLGDPDDTTDSAQPDSDASARPPIYFGLPPVLRRRRLEG